VSSRLIIIAKNSPSIAKMHRGGQAFMRYSIKLSPIKRMTLCFGEIWRDNTAIYTEFLNPSWFTLFLLRLSRKQAQKLL
jgi:hypothetical protein